MNETVVIVNPTAGGGRAGRFWDRMRPLAETLSAISVVMPSDASASRRAVAEALASGCRRVVAVGGDGTAHLVANALLSGGGEGTIMGIVPAGTGSDLARALGIPRAPAAALRQALAGSSVLVDAGLCDGPASRFAFVNIASAGISGLVDEAVNAMPGRGRTAFLRATLAALRRYRCVPVRVSLDDREWYEGPLFLLAVANGTTFGKGMRVAPGARLDDGLFDVVAVGEVSGWELVVRLPQVYLGRHLHARPVRHARARRVRLEPLAPLPPLDVDGETYPSGPLDFTVAPGALRIAASPFVHALEGESR
ncbi:MAG: diacylglycerol kinase family lipid kinase [Acidobacteriia bacterium]|nr:diacylglycerol kinase family lipid kinase [Terriglobia bacterium]